MRSDPDKTKTAQDEASSEAFQIPPWPINDNNETLIGHTIHGRYLIENELGRGGMGIVYLARDQQLHRRQVVVKLLLDKAFLSDYVLQKFHQEIEALSRLNHPGIVGILDTGELPPGRPFIVMQYVEGETLRSRIKPGGLSLQSIAHIMKQIGRALNATHDRGILHRDLKPENIMLQELGGGEELVKIIDFGVAKVKDSLLGSTTAMNVSPGTIAYMAPEQLSGEPITRATDIYAFGVIAYEILTGRKPFNPETAFQHLHLQQAGLRVKPSDLRPGVPAEAERLIIQALSFRPEDRPATASDFSEALARALSGAVEGNQPNRENIMDSETVMVSTIHSLPPSANVDSGRMLGPAAQSALPGTPSIQAQSTGGKSRTARLIGIAAVILACVIGAGVWYAVLSSNARTSGVTAPIAERVLGYKLIIQRMRDNQPDQPPFTASGEDTFQSDWKFRLDLSSPQTGYLYLLNEGRSADGAPTYNMLFPEPATNSGSAQMSANQNVLTGWMVFVRQPGREKFWMVWSAANVPELDALQSVMNPRDKGVISDETQLKSLREFLDRHGKYKLQSQRQADQQTIVKANGDVLVNLIELDHR
jgi:serine/threonine protein kinase